MNEAELIQKELVLTVKPYQQAVLDAAMTGKLFNYMSRARKPKMCIIGPPTARAFIENVSAFAPREKLRTSGNSAQRRKVRRFFTRQRNEILRLAAIPDDNGERMLVRTAYPRK